jgi:hypothetical protein
MNRQRDRWMDGRKNKHEGRPKTSRETERGRIYEQISLHLGRQTDNFLFQKYQFKKLKKVFQKLHRQVSYSS